MGCGGPDAPGAIEIRRPANVNAGTPTRRQALGRLPTPPPLPENLLSDCTENCPLRPCEHPGRFPFTYRFAARAPCDSKGSECQCGIHTAEAASALRSRKTERAAKEKPTPISQIFFSTCSAVAPQLAATPWGGSPPRPLRQKICYSDCTKNCPLCPLRAPRRFRNPKICQQLGAQPTPRFRVMIEAMTEAMIDVEIDALINPLPPFTFCRPFSFDSKLIW